MRTFVYFLIFVIVSLSSASCRNDDKRAVVDKDSFKHLCSSDFRLSESKIRRHIADLMFEDKDAQGPALSAKDYYTNNNHDFNNETIRFNISD